jgi:sugar (pentulose or hexulose) kinase
MMAREYVIGIDIVTSGCESILVDADGIVVSSEMK